MLEGRADRLRLQVDLVGLGDGLGLHGARVELALDVDHVVHLLGHDGVLRVVVGVLAGRQAVPAPLQRTGPLHVGSVRVASRPATARHLVADEEANEHGEDDGDDDGDGEGFHRGRGSRRRLRGLLGTETHSGTCQTQQNQDVSDPPGTTESGH